MQEQDWIRIFQEKIEELDRGDSWGIEFDDTIVGGKLASGWQQYIRSTFGRFTCSKCKKGWPSKRVTVLFHMCLRSRDQCGTVKARLFKQQCRRCKDAPFEEPHLKVENVEVLLEKLMEKIRIKCYREDLGQRNRHFHFDGRVDGPHETAHCEACLQGICTKGS
ncbi:receptor-transporting protein 2-like [Megalops cyprinoides]|uniref:receptor-transporting protein 2-like n=1 Tax=Megalops cyprinoides TaxID=118141 RepID=UPI0018641409|nr:receptor-transporting protein 2-like [Megalops cyprinoides]